MGKFGQKRYFLRYSIHSKKRSITIGKFPEIEVSDVCKIARKHITLIASGVDPKQERENHKQMPTLDQFFNESYFPFIKQKKRSFQYDVQRYTDYVSKRFGSTPYDQVKAINIQRLQMDMLSGEGFTKAYTPATFNRTLALLKTMGQQAVAWEVIEISQSNKIKLLKDGNTRTCYFTLNKMQAVSLPHQSN